MRKTSHIAASCRKGENVSALTLPLFAWAAESTVDAQTEKQLTIRSAEKNAGQSGANSPASKTKSVSTSPISGLRLDKPRAPISATKKGGTHDTLSKWPRMDHKHSNAINNSYGWERVRVDPQSIAEAYGAIQTTEPCSRCGVVGRAYYARDGWGLTPRSRCGDPRKCGEKPNNMNGPLLLIDGGKA